MINYADKMEQEARLKGNLAEWMEKHGNVLSDRQRSNAYTGVRILEAPGTGRWLADPAKTQAASTPLMHRDGLIAIG